MSGALNIGLDALFAGIAPRDREMEGGGFGASLYPHFISHGSGYTKERRGPEIRRKMKVPHPGC